MNLPFKRLSKLPDLGMASSIGRCQWMFPPEDSLKRSRLETDPRVFGAGESCFTAEAHAAECACHAAVYVVLHRPGAVNGAVFFDTARE